MFKALLCEYRDRQRPSVSIVHAIILNHVISVALIDEKLPFVSYAALANHFPWHDQIHATGVLSQKFLSEASYRDKVTVIENAAVWDWVSTL